MRKRKTSKPSPRRPKPKKCAECETNMSKLAMAEDQLLAERFAHKISVSVSITYAAERDEARKQHLVATQRNVELTNELYAANAALQQYMTSYQTYVGRIKEADRTLAQMENQRRAEDAKNCLQWWHCSSTMTIFLAIP